MKATKSGWHKRGISMLLALSMCLGVSSAAFAAESEDGGDPINWVSMYGEEGTNTLAATCDSINDVALLFDGSYALVGAFDGSQSDAEDLKGKTDAVFLLSDAQGNVYKRTVIGGGANEYFYSTVELPYGGFVAVGASQSEDGDLTGLLKGGYDGLAASFDEDGNLLKYITVGGSSKDELRDVIGTLDGGCVAVGYTQSNDGDIAVTGKDHTNRDALIVKLDKDLNIQWIQTYGVPGTATTGMDDFFSVQLCNDGGFITVGQIGETDDSLGKNDICIVKYSEDGELLWEKVYGGSADDVASGISLSPYKTVSGGGSDFDDPEREPGVQIVETGFVVVGTTKSSDGIFAGSETESGVSKAFFLKIDKDGEIESLDILENSEGAEANSVQTIPGGYLVAGTFKASDLRFTGMPVYGKTDIYVAMYSLLGNYLGAMSFGGSDDDTILGVADGGNDDFILYGNTKSSEFYGNALLGRYDGYFMSVKRAALTDYAEERYLVPVAAWKADADEPSMMAPLLYKDAYVEKTGEQYRVTVYFTNAMIMGTQVNSSTLGAASYSQNGVMTAADPDVYDVLTQVKSSTMILGGLSKPVDFSIAGTMGSFRLSFDEASMSPTNTPPYFPPVEVVRPDFDALWKVNIGGSDVDYASDVVMLQNGHILAVGETYSNDGVFADPVNRFSRAYICEYDGSGNLIKVTLMGGANFDSSAYAAGVDAAADGGYFVCGGYEEGVYNPPSGSFEALGTPDSVHGQIDGFYAKYDSDGTLVWMRNFSGSAYDQVKQIKATADGGCLLLIESNSEDGDMQGMSLGLFDLVLVKCDSEGNREWMTSLSGSTMQSSSLGTVILADGSYLVGGYAYLGYTFGPFEDLTWYGDTFDLFAVKVNTDGSIEWVKSYGGDKNDYCNGVIATSDGGFLMTGSTKSTTDTFAGIGTAYDNPFVLKCGADGSVEWADVIKSSENGEAVSVIETADRYIVVGDSYGTDFDFAGLNKGSRDVFLAAYSKDGERVLLDMIGGVNAEYAAAIARTGASQATILFYGMSDNGDLAGMNYGDFDATLLTFALDEESVDKSALAEALEAAKAIDNSDGKYTESSFERLVNAIRAAEAVYNDPSATGEQVDEQTSLLYAAIAELAPVQQGDLDKNSLKDGVYWVYINLYRTDRANTSMADNAVAHKARLEVIGGEYYITLEFKGMSFSNMLGYLSDILYYDEGYVYDENGVPTGETAAAEVLSLLKDADGNILVDPYNDAENPYPESVRFRLVPQAIADEDGFVPLSIFIPIMDAIAPGNGRQNVLMKIDWATLEASTGNGADPRPESPKTGSTLAVWLLMTSVSGVGLAALTFSRKRRITK